MRTALRLTPLPAVLTVVLLALALALPGRAALALHVYVLLLAAFALLQLVRSVRAAHPVRPSAFDAALRRPVRRDEGLPELTKVERDVTLGMATAFDLHYRLRPSLRRTARELLLARRGIRLDGDPEAARRTLGEEAWELVREDREPPRDRFAAGVDTRTLTRVTESLEAL